MKEVLDHILIHEGGKVDHPQDPGGRTNKGITQRVYNGWCAKNRLPIRDVYLISDNEVEAIYRFQYWEPIHGSILPPGVNLVVMDGAVNSGVKQSVKWLQRALGFTGTAVDGIIGTVTLKAIADDTNHDLLIARILDRRMTFLKALKTWKTFGKGWTRRVDAVRATGQAWAMGTVGPAVEYVHGGEEKAVLKDAKKAPPKMPGDVGMGGAGGIVLSGSALDATINEQLGPLASLSWISNMLPWVIGLAVVLGVVAAIYRSYAKAKTDALKDALDTEEV